MLNGINRFARKRTALSPGERDDLCLDAVGREAVVNLGPTRLRDLLDRAFGILGGINLDPAFRDFSLPRGLARKKDTDLYAPGQTRPRRCDK